MGYTAPYSPSLGASTPHYLFGGIDPTFFLAFQMAALLLLFDATQQHSRNRIKEVLDSKPVSNLEYLAGRVLGVAFLVWLIVVANVLAMEGFGLLSKAIGFNYAEPIQIHSIINLLLIDSPATLVVWCSVVVFLSSLLRARILTVLVALLAMFAWFFLTLTVPYSMLSFVSASSNDSLFVSDLVPQFASWQSMLVRLGSVLGALALVVVAATVDRRGDKARLFAHTAMALFGMGLCAGAYALSATDVNRQFGQPKEWNEAHKSYEWNGSIDLQKISGNLHVAPGERLDIDLELSFAVNATSNERLVFTFNPAMSINSIEIDGVSATYTFEDGLLEIASTIGSNQNSTHSLRVVASGRPDPRFGYFDSAVDYFTDPKVPVRSVRMLGKDGCIFESNFVALMPGVYWYPTPGPVRGDFHSNSRGKDYFDMDLSVQIQSDRLKLVGTGTNTELDDQVQPYRMTSDVPVPEIALFAADYESASLETNGMTFSMHLHKRHARNLTLTEGIHETLVSKAQDWLQPFSDHGFNFPHQKIAFVEVPSRLRTVGGGWRMDNVSALPGVVLMKAHGFPRTLFNLALSFAEREEDENDHPEIRVNLLAQFFAMGLGTENSWSTAPEHLWSHVTSAKGKHSEVLDQIVLALIASQTRTRSEFFSIYSAFHIANTTAVTPYTLNYGSDPGGWAPDSFEVRESEISYGSRESVWAHMEQNGFSTIPSSNGNQSDIELLVKKSNMIADGMVYVNGFEKVFEWLTDVRERFTGQCYTYEELIEMAIEHGVVVEPFLTDWLHESQLPGYLTKPVEMERIADDEQGNPRYQTSLTVRNVQPVQGFIGLSFPAEQYDDFYYGSYHHTEGFRIDGNTAKQINILTPYPVNHVIFQPYLSLNRQQVSLWTLSDSIQENPNAIPSEPEELSDWEPKRIGIVIDDLDSGFTVFQPTPNTRASTNVGPRGWFRAHRLNFELDKGLPISDGTYMPGISGRYWMRRSEQSAFGDIRRTLAVVWVRDPSMFHIARFTTEISESALWKLEYHLPLEPRYVSFEDSNYRFTLVNEDKTWDLELDVGPYTRGWTLLGEFELESGTSNLDVVGPTQRGFVVADAIRWTKLEKSEYSD